MRGAITEHIDVAQVTLYVFWVFFAGLVFYLRQEDRREGYPLENAKTGQVGEDRWPFVPDPKTFRLADGGTVTVPNKKRDTRPIAAKPIEKFPGAPLEPTGNPMIDGVGPAAWAERWDVPDHTIHGDAKIVPMRTLPDYSIAERDPDPRGMPVIGVDGRQGGTVVDVWIDTSEHLIRYLEVDVGDRAVLLPMTFSLVKEKPHHVYVNAITAVQFKDVPATKSPTQVTLREEDRICGYYGGGMLYAYPQRSEPIL